MEFEGQFFFFKDNPTGITRIFKTEWDKQQGVLIESGHELIKGMQRSFSGGLGGESKVSGRQIMTPKKISERELTRVEKTLLAANWEGVLKSLDAESEMRLSTATIWFKKEEKTALLTELTMMLEDSKNFQIETLK